MDWGLYILDTVIDNIDFCKNHFVALTSFGHHALHHLLPTIDHGLLPKLYPILFQTMEEFETEFKAYPWYFHVYGQLKQLSRVKTTNFETRVKQRSAFKNDDMKMKLR